MVQGGVASASVAVVLVAAGQAEEVKARAAKVAVVRVVVCQEQAEVVMAVEAAVWVEVVWVVVA